MAKTNDNSALNMAHLALIKQAIDAAKAASDITVEAGTPGEGILSSTVIKKNGSVIGTINIPKDYVNNIIGLVSEDGEGNEGTFLKVNVAPTGDAAEYQYVDVAGLVEYVTSGSQSGDMFVVNIDPSTHQVTVTATDGTITKAKMVSGVQTTLDNADTAYGWGDHSEAGYIVGEFATDAEVRTALGLPAAAGE